MAKTKSTTPTSSRTTASTNRLPIDPAKDRRIRQWACKIVSDLPSTSEDALLCLGYAEALVKGWVDLGLSAKPRSRRAAR